LKQPVKIRLLQIVNEKGRIASDDLFELLVQEYEGESFFTPELLNEYLYAFTLKGLLESRQTNITTADGIDQKICSVTDVGKRSLQALL